MKLNKIMILFSSLLMIDALSLSYNKELTTPVEQNQVIYNSKYINDEVENSISTNEELLNFIENAKSDGFSKGKTFNLTNDIDLAGEVIRPVAIFSGVFNGNNHVIKNLKIDSSFCGNETGFIRILTENAFINDLKIEANIVVENNDTKTGGLVGLNKGTIQNCTFQGTIKGSHIVGGLCGENVHTGKIINCLNKGNVSGKAFTGGICGLNKGEISDCENKGIINSIKFSSSEELTLSNIGGVCGFNQNKITHCTNYETVGRKQVGGLIGGISGSSVGNIIDSVNHGEILGDLNIGGIVGYYAEFLADNKNSDFYELFHFINNILDKNIDDIYPKLKNNKSENSSLKYCYNDGLVIGNNSIGGVVGYFSTVSIDKRVFDISSCINEGQVEASKESLGGICGNQINGKIYECFNIGNICGKNANYVGGIVGKSGGEVAYCYALNDMAGKSYVGGIGGINYKLHDTYSICKIAAKNAFVGALSGQIDDINGNISNNFYVNDDFNGIDNIDYENKSTQVDKEQLASKGSLNLPLDTNYFVGGNETETYPQLKSFLEIDSSIKNKDLLIQKMVESTKFCSYVNFLDENGQLIKKISVLYGEDLDLNEVPLVPTKEGYFASWSKFNPINIRTNLYIKPVYDEIITTIGSEKGANPLVLVEGKFYDTTYVVLDIIHENILKENSIYTYINTYHIELKDDSNPIDNSDVKFKISLTENYENIHIGIMHDGLLEIIDSEIDGNYVVFDRSNENTYYLLDQKFVNWNNSSFVITLTCGIIGGVLVIGGSLFLAIYYIKKNKNKKNDID